ncbi:hypothetical protein ACSHWG_02450 [Leucobacter sp. Z1108]|uniref:hypothetical protein n=1 Tax=Leucobacter sp. Z1108 TaxID=3439066 RepID=UPI003F32F20F
MSVTSPEVSLMARRYLSPKDAAAAIPGMTTAKLSQMRFKGIGPKYYRPTPKTIVYEFSELMDFVESTARTGTAEA